MQDSGVPCEKDAFLLPTNTTNAVARGFDGLRPRGFLAERPRKTPHMTPPKYRSWVERQQKNIFGTQLTALLDKPAMVPLLAQSDVARKNCQSRRKLAC